MKQDLKKSMKRMKLADFISQIITEIVDGVARAQEGAREKGAIINPKHMNWTEEKKAHSITPSATGPDQAPLLSEIEFDILLTIGDDDKAQGGIGVFAASLGLGIKGEARNYSEAVNRIKFKILAKLPQQAES